MEEPSIMETSRASRRRSEQPSIVQTPVPEPQQQADTSAADRTVTDFLGASVNEPVVDMPPETHFNQQFNEDPPSIAPPFSVGPDSVGPPSVGPPVSFC